MSEHHELLRRICRELRVVSRDTFEHASLGPCSLNLQPLDAAQPDEKKSIGAQLWPTVYHFYQRGQTWDADRPGIVTDLTPIMLREHAEFGQELRRRNHGTGFKDRGWRLAAVETDCLRVSKGGVTLAAEREEVSPVEGAFQLGTEVTVRFPGHLPYSSPGFYLAIGEDGIPKVSQTPVIRLYFNVSAQGGLELMSGLTDLLATNCPAYAFKTLNHPDAYTRRDAAVLCLTHDDYFTFRDRLRRLFVALASEFHDTVPGFAKVLLPGVGLAEEPGPPLNGKLSFGQHRSFLAACGVARAFLEDRNTDEGRYAGIVQEFREADLDALQPYLNAGSVDVYGTRMESAIGCAGA